MGEEERQSSSGSVGSVLLGNSGKSWYIVAAYSGMESKAKANLEERIRLKGMESFFGNVFVPEEQVVEVVAGQKKSSVRNVFPGYIFVQMDLNDDAWHLVKDTPKITGFVGNARDPAPLTVKEIEALVAQLDGGAKKSRLSSTFDRGDSVKVIDGPFVDFNGVVDEVRSDKGKLRVLISIFGRSTPVELDFGQVERV